VNRGGSGDVVDVPVVGSEAADVPAIVMVVRRPWVKALLAATAVLTLASAGVQISAYEFNHGGLLGLRRMFDMQHEGNVPSWFSGTLLLACGMMFAFVWASVRQRREGNAAGWAVLALVCLAASIDEVSAIHETVGQGLKSGRGAFIYLVPGSLLLLGIALALRRFFAALADSIRQALAIGIGIWLSGAVVLEALEAAVPSDADGSTGIALLNTAQDTFELLGMILVLNALARYAQERAYRVALEFT
jgi:hypothetical protein